MSTPAGETRTIEIDSGDRLVLYARENQRAWVESNCFIDVSEAQ